MIYVKDLKKTYTNGKISLEVLKGINLDIKKGEYVAIMGPSGSGKSTFLNILACLDKLTSGVYMLEDRKVEELNDNQLSELRCEKIGFVFQAYNLLPKLTALENVELPGMYLGTPRKQRRKRAIELLEMLGLKDRRHHKPNEMSGGQKQRVAIARALMNKPSIILADEPTGNLDSKSSDEIMKIFKELNDKGITIAMVTHDEEIAKRTKRIIKIKDGEIQSDIRLGDEK